MKTRVLFVMILLFGIGHFTQAQEKKSFIRKILDRDTLPYYVGVSMAVGGSNLVKGVSQLNERLHYLGLPGINTTLGSYGAGIVVDNERAILATNYRHLVSTAVETEVNQNFPTQVKLEGQVFEINAYRALTRSRRFRTMLLTGFSATDYKLTLVDGKANNLSTFNGLFSNPAASSLAVIKTKESYYHLIGGIGFFYRNLPSKKFRFNVGMDLAYAYPIIRSNGWKQQFLQNATVYEVPNIKMDAFSMRIVFIIFMK